MCFRTINLAKMTIGIGKERGGLYYFRGAPMFQSKSGHGLQVEWALLEKERILLWHRRLGHPSFVYLECLFPKLFTNIPVASLRCEQCIYAKNHRVSFKISFNTSPIPFSCVHMDVWGPFSIPTASGAKYFVFY